MYSQQQYQPQQQQQYTPQYQQQYSPQYQPQQQQYSPQYQQQGVAPMQSQTTMITQQQPGMMMAPGMVVARESCRSNTRCIAYVDIVLSILQLINAIVLILAVFTLIAYLNNGGPFGGPPIPVPIIVYMAAAVGFILLPLCIADVVIACGLLKSTDPITPPQIAVEKAKCWRCYNIFFLIFSVIGGGVSAGATLHEGDGNFLWFVLRIVCVCVVSKYIQELEFTVVPVMGMGMGQTTTMMTTTAPGANQFGGQQQYQPQGSPSSQQQQPKPEQQGQQ